MLKLFVTLLATSLLVITGLIGWVYLMPSSAIASIQKLQRKRAGLVRMQTQVNGIETVYLDGGQGEPLVLLHGFGGQKDSFNKLAAKLTSTYRIIIPDLPSFGESGLSPVENYSVDAQLEHIRALIQILGLGRVSLAGNSMGGWIAAAYAAKYPEEVATLWLISTGGIKSAPTSELGEALGERGGSLAISTVEEFEFIAQYVMVAPPFIPQAFIRVLAERAIAQQTLRNRVFRDVTASPSLESIANNLTMPTLITWGERDQVVHVEAARILHQLLPNSKLKIMPNVGHLPMVEDAEQTAKDYLAFRAAVVKNKAKHSVLEADIEH